MRERPILFNGAMVRAILSGAKTQTRRAMKVQPVRNGRFWEAYGAGWSDGMSSVPAVPGHSLATNCPFGQPGDRLWVRETFSPIHSSVDGRLIEVDYRATYEHGHRMGDHMGIPKLWKPSIHMPRDACRLVLEITDVRVERLQAISDVDALAEGVDQTNTSIAGYARQRFQKLWTDTGGDWDANPWVWVIGFRRTEQ
ncbi:hypothetical protein GGR60_002733 [Xanthomonas arboricola]|uniref:hypothetical protein n=1 Tax=Xanthomonas euroxanthea TaxID=2259622 RepID=UPI00142F3E01|nr:hypothetical protein [Xanthomonas euroxanthea]NJC38179.1 hypothetical protein [Xanthomonas euroxanthea]